MPMLHENGSMRSEPKLDYIECAFGIAPFIGLFIAVILQHKVNQTM